MYIRHEYFVVQHYLRAWSGAVAWEVRGRGVVVQEVSPGAVDTRLTRHLPRSWLSPRASPAQFARSALASLGRAATTCGWVPHAAQWAALQLLPSSARTALLNHALQRTHAAILANKES